MRRIVLAIPAAILLAAAALAAPLVQANEPEPATYHGGTACAWWDADLRVLIVPPAFGSIYQFDPAVGHLPAGIVVTAEPAAPWDNEYTQASVEAVQSWEDAFHAYAAMRPDASHLAEVAITIDVAGPSFTPDAREYDVVILYPPVQDAGGRATQVCSSATGMERPSFIVMNQWLVYSYGANDMYNIVVHEMGHSLGLAHVEDAPGDIMQPAYPYYVGYLGNPRECISTLNLAVLADAFAWVGGAPFVPMPDDIAMPASEYAKVC